MKKSNLISHINLALVSWVFVALDIKEVVMAHSMIFIVLGIVQFYLGVRVTKIAYREFKKYKNDNNKK